MKIFKLLYGFIIAAGACISCNESPFDPTTDLGEEILNEYDSTLINFERNFKTVQLSLDISEPQTINAYFINTNLDTIRANTFAGLTPRVGRWINENEQALTYFEYDGEQVRRLLDSTSQDSIRLRVNFSGSISEVSLLLLSDTLGQKESFDTIPVAMTAETYPGQTEDSTAIFDLGDNFTTILEDIQKIDTVAIDNDEGDPTVDTIYSDIAFVMTSNAPLTELREVDNSFATFTIAPSDTSIGMKTFDPEKLLISVFTIQPYDEPVSSLASGKIAVFPIDLSLLWSELADETTGITYQSVLSAELTIHADSAVDKGSELNQVRFQHALERTVEPKLNTLNTSSDTLVVDSVAQSFTLRIEPGLNRFLRENQPRPDTAYLHLVLPRLNNGLFSKINWRSEDTYTLRAVLSTPR